MEWVASRWMSCITFSIHNRFPDGMSETCYEINFWSYSVALPSVWQQTIRVMQLYIYMDGMEQTNLGAQFAHFKLIVLSYNSSYLFFVPFLFRFSIFFPPHFLCIYLQTAFYVYFSLAAVSVYFYWKGSSFECCAHLDRFLCDFSDFFCSPSCRNIRNFVHRTHTLFA